ncbi:MAG: putative Flagellar chaperone FlgN [Nitrospira sp.]|jgi:flagellar biosynthesis/type III secretory pathway chaperone|nr:putative Flagellar chaperone FlgN [Nitrospira sp.]
MLSIAPQQPSAESHSLLHRLHDKIIAFQTLLAAEQQAIRSLSFGQFTLVTMQKSKLLEEIRELEQLRRQLPTAMGGFESSIEVRQQETELMTAIGRTDRMNRFNAALIKQSLEFLLCALRLWQRSPQSAALYSSSGSIVAETTGMVRTKG